MGVQSATGVALEAKMVLQMSSGSFFGVLGPPFAIPRASFDRARWVGMDGLWSVRVHQYFHVLLRLS